MIISGLEKLTLLDYPGKLAAIVFTYGCDMRCPYCHNPELVTEDLNSDLVFSEEDIFAFLERRKGQLDALVITGGEPTMYKDLEDFIRKVREIGFMIKLDSNGGSPGRVESIIDDEIVDYWAMDVKYDADLYAQGIHGGRKIPTEDVQRSINLIKDRAPDYEFRTTIMRDLHDDDAMHRIGSMIKGAKVYYIQNFRPGKTIDPNLGADQSFTKAELDRFVKIMEEYVDEVIVRE
jgi:pyruvate formate lyase activating enzyme